MNKLLVYPRFKRYNFLIEDRTTGLINRPGISKNILIKKETTVTLVVYYKKFTKSTDVQ